MKIKDLENNSIYSNTVEPVDLNPIMILEIDGVEHFLSEEEFVNLAYLLTAYAKVQIVGEEW